MTNRREQIKEIVFDIFNERLKVIDRTAFLSPNALEIIDEIVEAVDEHFVDEINKQSAEIAGVMVEDMMKENKK